MTRLFQDLNTQITKKNTFFYGLFAVGFVLFIYVFFIYNRTFPVSEGWYSNYAKLINEGKIPYKDFECLFPPLYMYIIAFITKIFGYKLIVLRLIGIIIFVSIGLMTYLIFTQVFSAFPSVVATITSCLYLQSEAAQVYYDYIRFMDLSIYISIFFLLKFIRQYRFNRNKIKKWNTFIFIAGFFGSVSMLFKQSSGTIYLLYCIVFLLIFAALYTKRLGLYNWICYMLGAIIPILLLIIYLLYTQTYDNFWKMIFVDALSAKGGGQNSSIFTLLFGWIGRSREIFVQELVPIIMLLIIIGIIIFLHSKSSSQKTTNMFIPMFLFSTIMVLGIGFCFLSPQACSYFAGKFDANFLFVVFSVESILFIVSLILLLVLKKDIIIYFSLSSIIFVIGYAVTTSGGLSESQSALALGFIFATLLHFCTFKYGTIIKIPFLILALMIGLSSGARKYITTYSWWGLTEASLWDNIYETNISALDGIFVSANSKNVLEGIVQNIDNNTLPTDEIFCFPHIPIFYVLSDRSSGTFTQVQWFDVASSESINKDILYLSQNIPKIIVKCNFPEYVKENHELMFNNNKISSTRKLENFLDKLIDSCGYSEIGNYSINTDYSISVYLLPDNSILKN